MKLGKDELKLIVREVMKEELKTLLPTLLEKMLAEQYLRRLVSESAPAEPQRAPRPRSKLSEMMLGDPHDEAHDEVPAPLENEDEGVYDVPKVGPKDMDARKKVQEELRRKVLGDDNPLAFLYEGTKPLPTSEVGAAPQVNVSSLINSGLAVDKFKKMFGGQSSSGQSQAELDRLREMKEAELKRKREALDVKVN